MIVDDRIFRFVLNALGELKSWQSYLPSFSLPFSHMNINIPVGKKLQVPINFTFGNH